MSDRVSAHDTGPGYRAAHEETGTVSARHRKIPEPLRAAARLARRLGWSVTYTGGGHLRWKPPSGPPVFTPSTPGAGNRSISNCLADLRRAGLTLEAP